MGPGHWSSTDAVASRYCSSTYMVRFPHRRRWVRGGRRALENSVTPDTLGAWVVLFIVGAFATDRRTGVRATSLACCS